MAALETLRGIGPATGDALRAVGVNDAAALRDLGVDAAYRRLIGAGARPH